MTTPMSEPATRRSSPDAPSVAVVAGTHTVPGGAATLRVHARNLAPGARNLRVGVVGLEQGWRPAPVDVPGVEPDETVTVETVITPSPGAVAGRYAFLVVVESSAGATGPESRTIADATVQVDDASDVVLAVEPADVRGARRKRVDIIVGNTGAGAADVVLDATGADVEVRLGAAAVQLGPAETVRVPATVRVPLRLVGGRVRHGYEVVATGRAAPQRVQGTFTSHAVLGTGMLRLAAVVAVMALWVTAVVVALPRLADQLSADDAASTAPAGATTPAEPDDGASGSAGAGADDPGGAEGGGADSGDDGDSGDASGDADADGLRVSGVVSGADPGDVVIDVVPTASLRSPGDGGAERSQPPVAPGKIAAAAMPLEPSDVAQRLSTRTNTSGVWALSGLSAATRYLVTVSKPGFGTQRVVLTGAELAATPLETSLQAGEGTMSGVLFGPDGPVGGVEVTLTDGTTTVTTRSATTGQVGRWQVDGLVTPSTYLVSASAPELGTESLLVTLPAAGSREVTLTLDAGVASISGRVVGTDSLGGVGGLGGITVTATDGTTRRTATTVTGDDAGRFLLPGLPVPASYTVTISGIGYSTVTREVALTTEGVSGWTISLTSSGGVVSGTVRDETGAGITAAGLTLTSGTDAANVYKTMSASDRSGSFRFSGVTPGTYVLSAEAFGHTTTYAEVVVEAGGAVEVDLTLRRVPGDGLVATSSITGRVFDASTSGQISCPILAEDQECVVTATVVAVDAEGTHRPITSTAQPDEPYRLPALGSDEQGLLPGRYIVTLTAPGYEPGRVTVTVPMAAEAVAAPVALVPSPSLVGTVLPRTGVLPDGVCIVARAATDPGTVADPCGADEPECRTATSRCAVLTDGRYEMDRLSAGRYIVSVTDLTGGYVTPEPQEVNLLPGEVQRYDILLERNGIISVTMLESDANGALRPAPNGWVSIQGTDIRADADEGGFAQLTNIPSGTYTILGYRDGETEPIARTTLAIGLNQEFPIQLVLTSGVDGVVAGVGFEYSAAVRRPIAGATIEVTGIVGYVGTVPQYRQVTFTTNDEGWVDICTVAAPDCTAVIPLVRATVDVTVTAGGFVQHSASGVPLTELANILMVPQAQQFTGTVALDPAGEDRTGIRFEVIEAPPGVVSASLSADVDGIVSFRDPSLSQDNRIRPGRYEIVAWLDGFADARAVFEVPLVTSTDPFVPPVWTLRQHARVGITAVAVGPDGARTPVPGAVMTLVRPDETRIERTAGPSQTVLDFGTLPAGAGYRVTVRIAGYAMVDQEIEIPPGITLDQPLEVVVVRLGTIEGDVVSVLGAGWTQALPGAVVTAERADQPDFTATTADAGDYSITGTIDVPGLVPGDWRVSAQQDDHQQIEEGATPGPDSFDTVTATNGTVSGPVPLGLRPTPSQLLVTVQDGENTVPGLDLQLVYSDVDRVVTVAPCTSGDSCRTEDGTYHFQNLLPVTYTLFVTGGGYMPLATTVSLAAGQTQTLLVPISAPGGSIQGQVLRTLADGTTAPLTDADPDLVRLALLRTDAELRPVTIEADGLYLIENVGGGTVTLAVQQRDTPGGEWATVVSRVVAVLPGQSSVVDLVIPLVSRAVALTVTSTNGTDLAGGLVTLTATLDGEPVTLGPQPLGRQGGAFVVTFTQVPVGSWVARVSGPAGHHGSHQSGPIEVSAASPGTLTPTMSIAETELRIQVAAPVGPLPPPAQVTVTAAPSSPVAGLDDITATLIPGAGDTVLYLPSVGWDLAVSVPGAPGWQAAVSPPTIASGTVRVLARVALTPTPIDTSTTVTIDTDAAEVGSTLEVTAEVAAGAGDPSPTGGEVTFDYRLSGEDDWTTAGSDDVAAGTASVQLDTTGWEAGAYTVRASFEPAEEWWQPSNDTATVTVTEPEPAAVEQPEPDESAESSGPAESSEPAEQDGADGG